MYQAVLFFFFLRFVERFIERKQSDSTKLPRREGLERVAREFLSLLVFMGLLVGCFNLINLAFTCHPTRFLSPIIWERVEYSFRGGVKSSLGWFPLRQGTLVPACLPSNYPHRYLIEFSQQSN